MTYETRFGIDKRAQMMKYLSVFMWSVYGAGVGVLLGLLAALAIGALFSLLSWSPYPLFYVFVPICAVIISAISGQKKLKRSDA